MLYLLQIPYRIDPHNIETKHEQRICMYNTWHSNDDGLYINPLFDSSHFCFSLSTFCFVSLSFFLLIFLPYFCCLGQANKFDMCTSDKIIWVYYYEAFTRIHFTIFMSWLVRKKNKRRMKNKNIGFDFVCYACIYILISTKLCVQIFLNKIK